MTISSDDDEDANEMANSYASNVSEEDATSISLLGKEPSIEDDDDDEEAENDGWLGVQNGANICDLSHGF